MNMKKFLVFLFVPALALGLVACNKTAGPEVADCQEIVLNIGDTFDAEVTATKGTLINDVPSSLYVGRSSGSAGSESDIKAAASKSVSAGSISTGYYQTATPTSFNWYVANQSFTVTASGTTMTVANNTNDIFCARVTSSSSSVAVTLNHIFAALGTLTMNTQSGYDITVNHWYITCGASYGTSGTYNLTTGAWSSTTPVPANTEVSSGSNNFYIPGSYTITCNYTLTKGEYSQTFTKSASVDLVRGKVNNITGTASGGSASEITLTVSVEAWGTNNINGSFS